MTILEINVAVSLHPRVPDRLAPLDVLPIELDELVGILRQRLDDVQLTA
jgi:hypothetical protein